MAKERIDKIIASSGKFSRKEVKELIRKGKITVDGKIILRPEEKYDPELSEISVNQETLYFQKYIYLMLYKPDGVITATEDASARTVMDLLPSEYRRREMFPVGRLDKDTEGLLLITDDGALAHELLSPGKHVDKTYFARVHGVLTEEDCRSFQSGVSLSDGYVCRPARLSIQTADAASQISEALVTIQEGKYHQVKRMFAAIEKPLFYLKRMRMGNVSLDPSLLPGQYRELTKDEVDSLRASVPAKSNNGSPQIS